jgi:hypothetical protein
MFKHITTCILLAVVSLQILNRTVIYIDYYVNPGVYAKNCENKAHPVMHCNGKCQMMKKLHQEEKKDSEIPAERKSYNDEIISSKTFCNYTGYFAMKVKTIYNLMPGAYTAGMPRFCFHPPGG